MGVVGLLFVLGGLQVLKVFIKIWGRDQVASTLWNVSIMMAIIALKTVFGARIKSSQITGVQVGDLSIRAKIRHLHSGH
jgi:hypothetical protein